MSHSFAQTLTLINGDANGDQVIDDTDLLTVLFAQGQSCSDCPEDLNGDGIVDDADSLIVNFAGGQSGAPAFVGSVQSPSGAFSRSIQLQLGDWVGGLRTVKVQAKPVGTEADASVPIYEWTVQVGGEWADGTVVWVTCRGLHGACDGDLWHALAAYGGQNCDGGAVDFRGADRSGQGDSVLG